MSNDIKKFLTSNALQLTMQVLTVAGLVIAMYITTRLSPLAENVSVLTTEVKALEEWRRGENNDDVHKSEFDQVVERINHISDRVDQIYSIVLRK